ncbi:MAG: glycosyltransferase [Candidatus Gastranaerophilales bacterium]|nr:glycosyltransferase [Candidatus Gastranaerophilales bacterium]
MYKILAVSPISIAGELIMSGLLKGFEQLSCKTLNISVKNFDDDKILAKIKKFNPDLIIGYDYGHFINNEVESFIKSLNKPVIHYFGDNPKSKFAHSGNIELISKLENSKNILFMWDSAYVNALKNKTQYLPLAADADLYDVKEIDGFKYNISFVGRPLTEKRISLLCKIIEKFPDKLSIFCYEPHFQKSVEEIKNRKLLNNKLLKNYMSSYKGFLKTEKELAFVYKTSQINLNITEQEGHGLNYRVFEVLASGGFLLTDYVEDIDKFFIADENIMFYKNNNEAIEKISKMLNNADKRKQIAKNGQEILLKEHQFKNRAEYIIKTLKIF